MKFVDCANGNQSVHGICAGLLNSKNCNSIQLLSTFDVAMQFHELVFVFSLLIYFMCCFHIVYLSLLKLKSPKANVCKEKLALLFLPFATTNQIANALQLSFGFEWPGADKFCVQKKLQLINEL